jgi:HEAT repeat protein
MDRPESHLAVWFGKTIRSRFLCGTLAGAGLLCSLPSLGAATAAGPELTRCPPQKLLATPVGFNDLIQLLNDPNREVRIEAINYLEKLNRPASESGRALVRMFNDPDLGVRVFAVRAAIKAGMPVEMGVPVVTQALVPEYLDVCCLATQVLGDIGPRAKDALPNLHACMKAPSAWVRAYAARATLSIDPTDTAAVAALQSVFEKEQGETREFATTALGGIVDGLIERLAHADPEVRRTAILRLEELGKAAASATPALVALLADKDLLVRAHAAQAALRAGAPARQIVGVVSKLLLPERLDVLRMATLVLIEIGPESRAALPKLHDLMNSPSIAVQLHASETVLRIDAADRVALKKLRKALHHHDADVRYFAVNSLGIAVMDSDLAALALHRAISDQDPKVATAAALQLSRTHDLPRRRLPDDPIGSGNDSEPAYDDVSPWIDALSNATPSVRRSAAICLTIAGPTARAAIPELTNLLGDSDPAVRLHAAEALWEIDHNAYPIMPTLVDLLLTNRGGTRIGAIYTLGRMGEAASDATPWLSQLLNDSRSFDRLLLAEAIVRIEPTNNEALSALERGLRNSNADVRYLSTVAMGAVPLSRKAAVEQAMCAAIEDHSSRVRSAAYETLSQLQVRNVVARTTHAAPADDIIPASAKTLR